jgi:hypothetical protein
MATLSLIAERIKQPELVKNRVKTSAVAEVRIERAIPT